ncbi:hypothetical protein L1887_29263 [Cichorium endivia]|nr:hypothetical protein L1887_29263 [Cichorium endivia]
MNFLTRRRRSKRLDECRDEGASVVTDMRRRLSEREDEITRKRRGNGKAGVVGEGYIYGSYLWFPSQSSPNRLTTPSQISPPPGLTTQLYCTSSASPAAQPSQLSSLDDPSDPDTHVVSTAMEPASLTPSSSSSCKSTADME